MNDHLAKRLLSTSAQAVKPCKNISLYETVILEPHHLNNYLYDNLKRELRHKIESKCISEGYVAKIYNIEKYSDGFINPENFTGSVLYNVKYTALIYNIKKKFVIVGKMAKIRVNNILSAVCGPINLYVTINVNHINNNIFVLKDDNKVYVKKTDEVVNPGQYFKFSIINYVYQSDSRDIKAICCLEDVATQHDVDLYFIKEIELSDDEKKGDSNKFNSSEIFFNEDEVEEDDL
ncbi:putative DNA-directed RNA polymerase II subunit Rpb7 [Namao virus]|nr:putative DNA-directed RNA polymerase II subunit Rpb7 [Namao virus]